MNKTKIVCTIGPACSDLETLKQMMLCGMDVARFNMSHGNHQSHKILIDLVKQARAELGLPVAIMLDTRGPEIRIKQFKKGSVTLFEGQAFALTTENVVGDENIVSVTYERLPEIVKKGTRILLNDGLIELEVSKKTDKIVFTKVVVGGELSNNKSINIPSVELNMDYLSDIDKRDIEFGAKEGVDAYAISFVNHASDVVAVREYLHGLGVANAFIISKLESAKGVDNMDDIISASDGIMVARGDMGVEIPFEKLPKVQKDILKKCKEYGKYSITATQMLETMVTNTRPTRAEISDVANAIYDGSCAIMLSGETSAGAHPVLAVKTMQKIADETERNVDYKKELKNNIPVDNVTAGIGYAACAMANNLDAAAILVTTTTGFAASCISRFRPACNIVALTPNLDVYYKLGMLWGVIPLLDSVHYDTDTLLTSARNLALDAKCVKVGDVVIQTAGIMNCALGSNMLMVSKIEDKNK